MWGERRRHDAVPRPPSVVASADVRVGVVAGPVAVVVHAAAQVTTGRGVQRWTTSTETLRKASATATAARRQRRRPWRRLHEQGAAGGAEDGLFGVVVLFVLLRSLGEADAEEARRSRGNGQQNGQNQPINRHERSRPWARSPRPQGPFLSVRNHKRTRPRLAKFTERRRARQGRKVRSWPESGRRRPTP